MTVSSLDRKFTCVCLVNVTIIICISKLSLKLNFKTTIVNRVFNRFFRIYNKPFEIKCVPYTSVICEYKCHINNTFALYNGYCL